jgi:hypothetical protein
MKDLGINNGDLIKLIGNSTHMGGFAPTKALAKAAKKIAKKFHEQTEHVHVIDTEEKRIKALKYKIKSCLLFFMFGNFNCFIQDAHLKKII